MWRREDRDRRARLSHADELHFYAHSAGAYQYASRRTTHRSRARSLNHSSACIGSSRGSPRSLWSSGRNSIGGSTWHPSGASLGVISRQGRVLARRWPLPGDAPAGRRLRSRARAEVGRVGNGGARHESRGRCRGRTAPRRSGITKLGDGLEPRLAAIIESKLHVVTQWIAGDVSAWEAPECPVSVIGFSAAPVISRRQAPSGTSGCTPDQEAPAVADFVLPASSFGWPSRFSGPAAFRAAVARRH